MNKKTKLSIILALLMVVSTLSVGTVNADNCNLKTTIIPEETLEVVKKVWNGTDWVDEYTAEIGETVTFNITITYTATPDCGNKATDIVVVDNFDIIDVLSYVIQYTDQYPPSESGAGGVWNLTEDYGIELWDPSSQGKPNTVSIYFNITFTCGCGELVNNVSVYAKETCCNNDLYGEDQATVTVECEEPCEPEIEVVKKVWNGTASAWADEIFDLSLGDIVKFKITMEYFDCDSGYELLNMEVVDELPCCLEFYETLEIYTTGEMNDPTEEVSADGKVVFWNWTYDRHVVLHNNDTLTIEFSAEFTNYCQEEDENCVYVEAWGCSGPTFTDEDCVIVDCTQPDTEFDKTVWDEDEDKWVDEINTSTGEILHFKLSLTYYGNKIYDIVKFVDVLPCILEYADNAVLTISDGDDGTGESIEGNVSEDGKTIWFNITDANLSDGETISILFDALVVGSTEGCCGCEIEAINYGAVYVFVCGEQEPDYFFEDELQINSQGNCPPDAPGVTGPSSGIENQVLTFSFVSTDPDDDQVKYMIDWGDESEEETAFYNSGDEVDVDHAYDSEGTYEITAIACDEHGAESEETYYPHIVVVTKEEAGLSIIVAKFSRGLIKADIKNNFEEDLTDIAYEFNATGGLLGKVAVEANGTVNLTSGQAKTVCSGTGSVGFGFGKITGTIKATVDSYEETVSFSGFLIGKIVLITDQS